MYMLYTRQLYMSAIASPGGTHDWTLCTYVVCPRVCAVSTPCVYVYMVCTFVPPTAISSQTNTTVQQPIWACTCRVEHHQLVHPLHIHMVQFVYMQACTPWYVPLLVPMQVCILCTELCMHTCYVHCMYSSAAVLLCNCNSLSVATCASIADLSLPSPCVTSTGPCDTLTQSEGYLLSE
jgi:hypothetical protein